MKVACVSFMGLALLAVSSALPLGSSPGTDLVRADLQSWKREFMFGDQLVTLGLGWKDDGTIAAGANLATTVNGERLPLSAAISTNVNNMKDIKYQLGAQLLNKLAGVLYGDANGALKYLVEAWLPTSSDNDNELKGIGASIEGDHLKPVAIGAGVDINGDVIQARVGLNDKYVPNAVNVQLGL